jgi:hypothetical protein
MHRRRFDSSGVETRGGDLVRKFPGIAEVLPCKFRVLECQRTGLRRAMALVQCAGEDHDLFVFYWYWLYW